MTKSITAHKSIDIKTCAGRSCCPLTNALDIIGDKWTLLIVRDIIFIGKSQFGDFLESPEGISTNILTDRLKKLEEYGLVNKTPYQKKPMRYAYTLTQRGLDLKPVMMEILNWGHNNIEGTAGPSEAEIIELRKKYTNRAKDQTHERKKA